MSHGEESTKVVISCKFLLLARSFRASLLRAGVFRAGISFLHAMRCLEANMPNYTARTIASCTSFRWGEDLASSCQT